DAIVWVADHPRRELWVGMPTVATIWGGRLFPGLVDRYLGRTNYEAQQTDRPIGPDRPSSLWHPLPGDHGAHGIFDAQAKRRSPQVQLARHRAPAALSAAAVAGAAVLVARRRR
ncbi:MAG: short-chain dehydrogenase, partial [Acidimicrobiales bacterium]